MKLNNLRIFNFRNILEYTTNKLPQVVVLLGENAQGKTNFLEAIYVATTGGSFRGVPDSQLVGWGGNLGGIEVSLEEGDGKENKIQISIDGSGERAVKKILINNQTAGRGELMSGLPIVVFTPEDLDLIRLSPNTRRKFLDLLLSRLDREYYQNLVDYLRVWKQRNQLLLLIKQGKEEVEILTVWDDQMASLGSKISEKRNKVIRELNNLVEQYYNQISSESEFVRHKAQVSYLPNINSINEREYYEVLVSGRSLDVIRATTSKGVHRDDLKLTLNGQDIKETGSRGEYRSFILALKLAEAELLKRLLNENPILLLDDVASELDLVRKKRLFEICSQYQMFITTNQIGEELEGLEVERLVVRNGKIEELLPFVGQR